MYEIIHIISNKTGLRCIASVIYFSVYSGENIRSPCPCKVVQTEMLQFTMSMSEYKYKSKDLYSANEIETIVMRDVSTTARSHVFLTMDSKDYIRCVILYIGIL